jgi:hypothetical protein
MARKKKNDFWDDVDDIEVAVDSSKGSSKTRAENEEWSAVKCTPLKVIVRIILMIACLVALGSAYIAYEYVGDRYAGGSYSTDFYNSGSFATEYNKSMSQLMQLVKAMEADPSVTQTGNEEMLTTLVENYLGKDTNFSFLIQDSDRYLIVSSGDDAKDRITNSSHYVLISNVDGEMTTQSTIAGSLLDKDAWSKVLSETSNTYIIYSAVDNELTQTDAYYKAEQAFNKMEEYFGIARFVGIIAAVIFIICLIFCIMATGMKRGYPDVCLTWFDKIFTEIALVIMAVVAAAILYGIYRLHGMTGDTYQYAAIALVVVAYAWIIRSYFSIVRRIKAGRLLRGSLIGTIIGAVAGAVGKLPSPLNVIVGAIILIAINGGLVYGLIFMRQYTVKGIPVMFIAAPVVVVIELLAVIVHNSSRGIEEEEAVSEDGQSVDTDETQEKEKPETEAASTQEVTEFSDEEHPDWEAMDLGKAIENAERSHAQQEAEKAAVEAEQAINHKTEVLSVEDVEKAIRASGLTPQIVDDKVDGNTKRIEPVEEPETKETAASNAEPEQPEVAFADDVVSEETVVRRIEVPAEEQAAAAEDEGRVNFVQLNKDVRKEFKAALKSRGIAVTVRAPEKPVIIDIDRNSLHIIIKDIFEQIERLSAPDTRNYVEVYLQGDKVVYIVKINVDESAMQDAQAAVSGDGSFESARKIIEANDGKFIVTLDGNVLKAGMLIDAAE